MQVTVDSLLDKLGDESLSSSLAKALRLADRGGNRALAIWCRLELGGYWSSNSAMTEDVVVPEYRTVPGQHTDIYGRALVVPPDLAFIGETRLRNGIEELETLTEGRDEVVMHDPDMCALLREHLEVEVYAFRFSVVHLRGVLAAIRQELADKLERSRSTLKASGTRSAESDEEIFEVRPNLWGVGVNLRALWRRWKGPRQEA